MIVEETPPSIRESALNGPDCFKGQIITASRLEGIDRKPLFEAANIYLQQRIPYGWGDVCVLGLLLLRKNLPFHTDTVLGPRLKDAVCAFLKLARRKSDVLKMGMFCSEFVYQCFEDAGYVLEINNPTLPLYPTLAGPALAGLEEAKTLLDLAIDQVSCDDNLVFQRQPSVGLASHAGWRRKR